MKKRVFVMASLLVLSIMVAAQVVRAEESMFVNIPFAFTAGVDAVATIEVSVVGNGSFSSGEGDVLGEAAASACG